MRLFIIKMLSVRSYSSVLLDIRSDQSQKVIAPPFRKTRAFIPCAGMVQVPVASSTAEPLQQRLPDIRINGRH